MKFIKLNDGRIINAEFVMEITKRTPPKTGSVLCLCDGGCIEVEESPNELLHLIINDGKEVSR